MNLGHQADGELTFDVRGLLVCKIRNDNRTTNSIPNARSNPNLRTGDSEQRTSKIPLNAYNPIFGLTDFHSAR